MSELRGWTGSLRFGIAAGALCAFALATAVPADAYLRDLQTLDTGLVTNSLDRKTVQAGCPAGKTALSAGAEVRPQQGTLIPTGLALQSVFGGGAITADEADAITGNWTLAGQTQCVSVTSTPPTPGTEGPYVKDVRIVHSPLPYSRSLRKEIGVDCPPGAPVPIGGGFFFHGHVGQTFRGSHLAVGRSMRLGGRFITEAHSTDLIPPPVEWALSATAICADIGGPGGGYPTDLTSHSAASPINSNTWNNARAECPPDKVVVGGGAYVETPGTNPPFSVVLRSSLPSKPQGQPWGWGASGIEEDPESPNWRVVARAYCARLVN